MSKNRPMSQSRKKRMQRIVVVVIAGVLAGLMVLGGVMPFFTG